MFVEEVEVKTLTHSSRRQVFVGEKVEVKTLDTQLQATGVCGGEGGGEDIGHTAPGGQVFVGEKVEVKTLDTQLQAAGVCGGEGGGEDTGHTAPGDRCLWRRRWR